MSHMHLFAQTAQLLLMQQRIADAAVLAELEDCPSITDAAGQRWYDVRPMLDEREHCAEVVDMATLAVQYALARPLVVAHPDRGKPYLLRLADGRAASTGSGELPASGGSARPGG